MTSDESARIAERAFRFALESEAAGQPERAERYLCYAVLYEQDGRQGCLEPDLMLSSVELTV